MRHETDFSVRYLTDDPVPIRDIIDSLQGIETILGETRDFLPAVVDGLVVQRIELRVREISQESPLRELFLVALIVGFQKDLEREVVGAAESLTGYDIPPNLDTIFTVAVLILIFYGVGAIKDLVVDRVADGPSRKMLDDLISELAADTGKQPEQIRKVLDDRYGDRTLWKRIANATSRIFAPSKRQNSAPIEVNARRVPREVVQDVPAQYLVDHEADSKPSRPFRDVTLELHAQDKDNAAKGWAAVARGISERRLRLRLMDDVSPTDVWGRDLVRGDITVVYEKVGVNLEAKEIHLHRISAVDR